MTPKTEAPQEAKLLSRAFANTAKAVGPSVVRIDVEKEAPRLARGWNGDGDALDPSFGRLPAPFRQFFNFGGEVPDSLDAPAPVAGTGSGFLLDAAGNIITNSHVVEGGARFKVTLDGGVVVPAKVVGEDRRTDVAVIRLEHPPGTLPAARLGDSSKTEVGEWVLAIGSPLGLEKTVTAGIVSGKGHVGRNIQMSGDRVREYIQTDAKINPGNSGGPLVNLNGEVIGINTLIRVGAGGAYGFAVPINEAHRVAQALIEDGRVRYPFLGVNVTDVDRLDGEAKTRLQGSVPAKGAYVVDVTSGSPAAKAGIKPGDVVTRLGDRRIGSASEVVDEVSSRRIGDTLPVTIVRGGESETILATLEEAPGGDDRQDAPTRLGLSLQPLTPGLAGSLGIPREARGVVIAEIADGSAAAHAGLQSGEVIVEIDHQPVRSAEEAAVALRDDRQRHLLRVLGARGMHFVTLDAR